MEPFRRLRARTVVIAVDDVDTDQIIPARFLKGTSKEGLGAALFADWSPRVDAQGAQVLVTGRNFGCGSSREHAVWALMDHGFRTVVSTSFADIFKRNALKNGLLPVEVDADTHARLLAAPGMEVTIDLEAQTLRLAFGTGVSFTVEPFARHCLLSGLDELSFLLSQEEAIATYERGRPSWSVEV